jgi:ribonuclease P/MRP protein subunit RPP1
VKKTFSDLHLHANPKKPEDARQLIAKAAKLGYSLIAVPTSPETSQGDMAWLREVCGEVGVDFVSRLDLHPRSQGELLRLLRKFRRRFELVCVVCESKEIARQAAKDRRVDLLNFPSLDWRKRFFDRAEAELASGGLAGLEIDMGLVLVLEGRARVRLLSSLQREIAVAREFHVPVALSSGVEELLLLRMPREVAALAGLFGLDEAEAVDSVSRVPVALVQRNRLKLRSGFVAPGIHVVREGDDC